MTVPSTGSVNVSEARKILKRTGTPVYEVRLPFSFYELTVRKKNNLLPCLLRLGSDACICERLYVRG